MMKTIHYTFVIFVFVSNIWLSGCELLKGSSTESLSPELLPPQAILNDSSQIRSRDVPGSQNEPPLVQNSSK